MSQEKYIYEKLAQGLPVQMIEKMIGKKLPEGCRTYQAFERLPIRRDVIRLENHFAPPWLLPPSPADMTRQLIEDVAEEHDVTYKDIMSLRRDRKIAFARHDAMWRVHTQTKLSYPAIGRIFKRDHSTVISGIRGHISRMSRNA